MLVGVGQVAARNLSPEAHVIELGLLGTKTRFDVAETFPEGKLCKGQAEELVQTGEALDLVVAGVALHTGAKSVQRQKIHELGEDGSPSFIDHSFRVRGMAVEYRKLQIVYDRFHSQFLRM